MSIYPRLLDLKTSNLVHGFVWGMPSGHTNNFPKSVRVVASGSVQWEHDQWPNDGVAAAFSDGGPLVRGPRLF